MPHVVRYNAIKPRKHALFPKYEHFVADERYAHIARMLGFQQVRREGWNHSSKQLLSLEKLKY